MFASLFSKTESQQVPQSLIERSEQKPVKFFDFVKDLAERLTAGCEVKQPPSVGRIHLSKFITPEQIRPLARFLTATPEEKDAEIDIPDDVLFTEDSASIPTDYVSRCVVQLIMQHVKKFLKDCAMQDLQVYDATLRIGLVDCAGFIDIVANSQQKSSEKITKFLANKADFLKFLQKSGLNLMNLTSGKMVSLYIGVVNLELFFNVAIKPYLPAELLSKVKRGSSSVASVGSFAVKASEKGIAIDPEVQQALDFLKQKLQLPEALEQIGKLEAIVKGQCSLAPKTI